MSVEILKFSASWCGPCRILAEVLKNEPNITSVDIEGDIEKAREFKIRNVPTLVFLKDGQEVLRQTGVISLAKYKELLNSLN